MFSKQCIDWVYLEILRYKIKISQKKNGPKRFSYPDAYGFKGMLYRSDNKDSASSFLFRYGVFKR